MVKPATYQATQATAQWAIDLGCNIFGTHTFGRPMGQAAIRRMMPDFHKDLRKGIAGTWEPRLCLFWFTEPHKLKGSFHFHSLIRLDSTTTTDLFHYWHNRYGRCKFVTIEPGRGAEFYCTKYMMKGSADYDFFV